MSRKSGWVPCSDQPLLVELCELWNKGRLYEILWEYSRLSASILNEREAKGWLYHENGTVAGFALGRERLGWWHMEELWGPCSGSNGIDRPVQDDDISRARMFRKLLDKKRGPILIRAAVDNPFANILARQVGAEWCGGFLLSEKKLQRELPVPTPANCSLRRFKKGDGHHLSRIHSAAFDYPHPPEEYEKWAMQSNCRTTIAIMEGKPVGFLIAEKRPYLKFGDFTIAVDPSNHGIGIGSALIQRGLNDLFRLGVRTAIADFLLLNAKVQALNRKYGFQIVRAYNYYRYGKQVAIRC